MYPTSRPHLRWLPFPIFYTSFIAPLRHLNRPFFIPMLHQLLINIPVILRILLSRYLLKLLRKPITAGIRLPNRRHLSKIRIHPDFKAGIRPSSAHTAFLCCLDNLVKVFHLVSVKDNPRNPVL